MASLAPTPTERDPILDKHLEDYMAISDEAEITDFELLQLMDNISHYNQIPEDRRVSLIRLCIYIIHLRTMLFSCIKVLSSSILR
jgi:hypothetical protein